MDLLKSTSAVGPYLASCSASILMLAISLMQLMASSCYCWLVISSVMIVMVSSMKMYPIGIQVRKWVNVSSTHFIRVTRKLPGFAIYSCRILEHREKICWKSWTKRDFSFVSWSCFIFLLPNSKISSDNILRMLMQFSVNNKFPDRLKLQISVKTDSQVLSYSYFTISTNARFSFPITYLKLPYYFSSSPYIFSNCTIFCLIKALSDSGKTNQYFFI